MIKAKFSNKTKEAIFNRDGGKCIICFGPPHSIHHIYFGTQSDYSKLRNEINVGVALCLKHHEDAHGCKQGIGIRQQCINYIKNYYDKN